VQATVHGDTGVVTGVSKSVVEYQGSVSSSTRRFLNVFSKKDGRWLVVAHFETNISEKPKAD
jgi:ketosteroid isomerase-like protein